MIDSIRDVVIGEGKTGKTFTFTVDVGQYGITASIPTKDGEGVDVECSGSAQITLDIQEAKELYHALGEFIEMVE